MSSSSKKKILLLPCIAVLLGSCVNLKHVGKFSETSIEGIEQYETISPTFTKVCLQDCQQGHIRTLEIHNTDCDCAQNQKADSITQVIYNAPRDYFYGLADLSQNELTNYKTDDFTKALATGDFGPIQLKETDVQAYSDISTLLLRAFTDSYRRKKIKEYVAQAHGPLLKLLRFLELNLTGNLSGKLEVQKSGLKNFYFDFLKDKRLSDYERTKFAEDYFRRISEITAQQKELETFAEILQEIAEAHTTLYNNVSNMTNKEARKELERYGRQMNNTVSSLRRM
ncbi:hypothetical protein [Pricia sp.]|uniref:hypothetical protein n=1 Tax=Pricia sp. TaxID=2268138 RepID=UPI003594029D